MEFPEITTKQVFEKIPSDGLEASAEFAWNATLWTQGICSIERKKVGTGYPDALIRFYSEDKKKHIWILGEYKKNKSLIKNALCQLLMYLGNMFYDVSLEGTDNFVGIISAGTDYFLFIPYFKVQQIMEKFEGIWHEYFRVAPNKAHEVHEIKGFVEENWKHFYEESIYVDRRSEGLRLDKLIKGIYEGWNLL